MEIITKGIINLSNSSISFTDTELIFNFYYESADDNSQFRLNYYGYRFYSPSIKRWLNGDPIGEESGLNIYGFVGNDGLNDWDAHGRIFGFGKQRWRKCKKGEEWTWQEKIDVPKADGCSNPFKGWILGIAGKGIVKIFPKIPDYSGDPDEPWKGASFLSACNFHDYCYSNCSKSKEECDKGLRDRAKQSCAAAVATRTFASAKARAKWLKKCNAWANAYYKAVKKAGGSAYKNRQKAACECTKCPNRNFDYHKRFGVWDRSDHYYPYGQL